MREADSLSIIVFIEEVKESGADLACVVEGEFAFAAERTLDCYCAVAECDCLVDNCRNNSISAVRAGDNAAAQARLVAFERNVDFLVAIAGNNLIATF